MQDVFRQDLQLAELADELDVAEHFALGEIAPLLLLLLGEVLAAERPMARLLQRLGPILEFEFALVEK